MEPKLENGKYYLDSASIYKIAENKRCAMACYTDMVIKDSLIVSQKRIIGYMEPQIIKQQSQIQELQRKTNTYTAKITKLKRNRITYMLIGAAGGILGYAIFVK